MTLADVCGEQMNTRHAVNVIIGGDERGSKVVVDDDYNLS